MSKKRKTPAELAAIPYDSPQWRRMTFADHAEAWTYDQGKKVPRDRRTKAWMRMYVRWAEWAFAGFGENPKTLTGYHLGDFIEFFEDEARVVSKVAGITLSKTLPRYGSIPIAGFPAHVLSTFRPIFKKAGYELSVKKGWPESMLKKER